MILQTNLTNLSLENIAQSTSSVKKKSLPPVHLWNPPFCGELDIRIARDGTWFYLGTPIGRPELVRLFSSILKKEGDRFFLVTPVEKVGIKVDDAPFVAVDFNVENHRGTQILTFETQVGDLTTAGQECPIHVVLDSQTGEPSPYVRVRSNLEALIDRKSFYRLIDYAVHHDGWFGVWSSGLFFPMIESTEINAE